MVFRVELLDPEDKKTPRNNNVIGIIPRSRILGLRTLCSQQS